MKLHRVRSTCRAPNRYSPSLALLQHFVLPHDFRRHQLFSSSTHACTKVDTDVGSTLPDVSAPETPSSVARASRVVISTYEAPSFVASASFKEKAPGKQKSAERKSVYQRPMDMQNGVKGADTIQQSYLLIEQAMCLAKDAANMGEQYTGLLIRPKQAKKFISEQFYPWATKPPYKTSDPMDRLDQEIHAFWDYIKPDEAEISARRAIIEQVRTHVRQRLPDHGLEVFGSERTGMPFALSDIDFRLIHPDDVKESPPAPLDTSTEHKPMLKDLWMLRHKVFSDRDRYNRPDVRVTRYPLLIVRDRASGIDVQIVLSRNTASSRELMERYKTEWPYIRQLHAVVKAMFDQRGFTDVYHGGFGSYAIFMMIVASLQHHANRRQDAAGALLNFLHYWAYFDTRAHGVSVSPPEYFDKNEHPVLTERIRAQIADGTLAPFPDWMLCLRDPADETNDLGRTGTCILHVQATLRELLVDVISGLNANKRASLLAPLLGEIYAHQSGRRAKLHHYGLAVQSEMGRDVPPAAKDQREGHQEEELAAIDKIDVHPDDVHGFLVSGDAAAGSDGGATAYSHGILSAGDMEKGQETAQEDERVATDDHAK